MYVRVSAHDHEGHKVTRLHQLKLAIDTDSGKYFIYSFDLFFYLFDYFV